MLSSATSIVQLLLSRLGSLDFHQASSKLRRKFRLDHRPRKIQLTTCNNVKGRKKEEGNNRGLLQVPVKIYSIINSATIVLQIPSLFYWSLKFGKPRRKKVPYKQILKYFVFQAQYHIFLRMPHGKY